MSINLFNYSFEGLAAVFADWGEPAYRADQVIQWMHQRAVINVNDMTDLSKSLRSHLSEHATVELPEIAYQQQATDGTIKWLIRLSDGNCIETVYIPESTRATLCISSQVGCALNCSFCATGKEGFNRNLTTAEIIGQLWLARARLKELNIDQRISNVVMMGMGEPMLNYDPVLASLELMLNDKAYGLSKYRVTVSTSGVVPAMLKLKQDLPVALAVSLHAPNNALRNQLVPINRKYPIETLISVCKSYFPAQSKRQVTYEYVMLDGINDQMEHADQLLKLLKGSAAKMNLIPFNDFEKSGHTSSSAAQIAAFQQRLMKGGLMTWVRKTRGEDVAAACGQLAGDIQDRTGRHARWLKTGKLVPAVRVESSDSEP